MGRRVFLRQEGSRTGHIHTTCLTFEKWPFPPQVSSVPSLASRWPKLPPFSNASAHLLPAWQSLMMAPAICVSSQQRPHRRAAVSRPCPPLLSELGGRHWNAGDIASRRVCPAHVAMDVPPSATVVTHLRARTWERLSWCLCASVRLTPRPSASFAVPQHVVRAPELRHGESGEHPPIQPVAPADADLGRRGRPCAQAASPRVPAPPGPRAARLRGGGSRDRPRSGTVFHIKRCFCCTKFVDVHFYYILPSEKKKKFKINFCVSQRLVVLFL